MKHLKWRLMWLEVGIIIIMYYIFRVNQKIELFVYSWLRAPVTFNVTCSPTSPTSPTQASNVIPSILSIHYISNARLRTGQCTHVVNKLLHVLVTESLFSRQLVHHLLQIATRYHVILVKICIQCTCKPIEVDFIIKFEVKAV